jgi:hypothetical protein
MIGTSNLDVRPPGNLDVRLLGSGHTAVVSEKIGLTTEKQLRLLAKVCK